LSVPAQTAVKHKRAPDASDRYPFGAVLQLVAKRVFDVIASAAMLALLSPLFLLSLLAVRLDSRGPIFSVGRQYCYNNQTIDVLTFWCRPSFIGRSLALSGLDKLPMLINVLRGDMSIVGLRPYSGRPSIPLSARQSLALRNSPLRPGLLSFEDVSGRVDSKARQIEADLFYISNWSLLLDAKILFRNLFSRAPYIQNHLHH
jgi:lipopolysaccharide/colanic/teichoic acid biosynthesis glycosyltransferase